jgi:hypothetical protein
MRSTLGCHKVQLPLKKKIPNHSIVYIAITSQQDVFSNLVYR